MNKNIIKEIIEINKYIKDGKKAGSVTYKNYIDTVKPKLTIFKDLNNATPNLYLQELLKPIHSELDSNYTLKNYSHYGQALHDFCWASIFYKYPHVQSKFASYSPQIYILVGSEGIKFGLDYGSEVKITNSMLKVYKVEKI